MKRRSSILSLFLASTMLCGLAAGASAQELLTADRIGLADAPKSMTFRTNPPFTHTNTTPSQAEGFKQLFTQFAQNHPDWQINIEYFTPDIGGEHARMLEQARAGRAPDCATVDSFQLALFIKQGALAPVDEFFTKEEIDDLFPFIKAGITGAGRQHLCVVVEHRPSPALSQQGRRPERAAGLGRAARRPRSMRPSKGKEGVLFNGGRWEGTTFDWLAQFWAQGGKLIDDSGKPIFGEGENREKMLKALGFYKDLVDSGAAPKRVATIKDYDDFNAAAIADTAAMFIGGHWQNFQLKEAMPADQFAKWEASAIPGPTVDERSTGTGGWTVAALSKDPEKIKLCMDLLREVYMGPGQQRHEPAADAEVAVRKPRRVQGSVLRDRQRVPGQRPGPSGRADLSGDLQPDPDHDG